MKLWPQAKLKPRIGTVDIKPCSIDQTVRTEYPCSKDCEDCYKEFWFKVVEGINK